VAQLPELWTTRNEQPAVARTAGACSEFRIRFDQPDSATRIALPGPGMIICMAIMIIAVRVTKESLKFQTIGDRGKGY
jgi:hypothetical protein